MKKLTVTLALLTALNPHARALETDQFTLPPAPLRDAGPAVADAFYRTLEKIALSNPPDAMTAAKLFYSAWAKGVPYCQAERWLNDGPEFAQGGRFAVDIAESIYVRAQPRFIFNKIAPTVNMYGVYFGTDKIGHLFQQGFEYFKVYSLGRRIGLSEAQAQKRAVSIGVLQERTYFGTITDGVYS